MDIENKIEEILTKIRPFLNNDGGDVELVKYDNGICYVRLLGSCADCALGDETISGMVEQTLKFEIPEIIEVRNVM